MRSFETKPSRKPFFNAIFPIFHLLKIDCPGYGCFEHAVVDRIQAEERKLRQNPDEISRMNSQNDTENNAKIQKHPLISLPM